MIARAWTTWSRETNNGKHVGGFAVRADRNLLMFPIEGHIVPTRCRAGGRFISAISPPLYDDRQWGEFRSSRRHESRTG